MNKKITQRDVDILLRIAEIYNTEIDFKATMWFWGEFKEKTYEEFRQKYPQGSLGLQYFERFTSRLELVGTLSVNKLFNEELWFEKYGSEWAEWQKAKPIVYGLRKEWNEPRYREYFELLVKKGEIWRKRHKSLIKQ
ncbi:MAG: hypothetical protein QXU32_13435 [Nitrososphaerales archaeon]